MPTTDSDFYKILCNINSQNVQEQLRLLVEECAAQEITYQNDAHPLDAAYICEQEILLVKCDMLPEKERITPWLSDEKGCKEDPPLFYSESSHRISPIYNTEKEKKVFEHIFPAKDFNIYILLLCNYQIINFDDIKEAWEENGIFIVDCISQVEMEAIKNSLIARKLNNEHFENLLKEFIAACEKEDDTEEDPYEDDQSDDNVYTDLEGLSPQDVFSIQSIRLRGTYKGKKRSPESSKALSYRNLISVCPTLEVKCWLDKIPRGFFGFRAFDETGVMIQSDMIHPIYIFDQAKHEYEGIVQFSIVPGDTVKWHKGTYLVEMLFQEVSLHVFSFSIGEQSIEGDLFINEELVRNEEQAIIELERMIGMKSVKEQIDTLRSNILMAERRQKIGLKTPFPTLHAIFCGNPGTGKTTVAKLYGKMLKELGILKSGHVIFEKRSTLMGQNYSSEQEKTLAAIEKAKGGVLFIDEAYLLYKTDDPKDPGRNVLETLLSEIDHNNNEWVLLMAGYTEEMNIMMSVNPGLNSRIPENNRLIFEDYSIDELMSIAEKYCNENNYFLSCEAKTALRNKIEMDYNRKDATFGNGRYVINLLTNNVLQAMSLRLRHEKNPSFIQLMRIEKEDIPEIKLKDNPFEKLHSMIGLKKLKMELEKHLNMVRMIKMRNRLGILSPMPPLHMAFLGNPGTGKTTVANLIGEIYASLGILSIGHVINVERKDLVGKFVGGTEDNISNILKKAKGNVLFIDEAYTLYNNKDNDKDVGQVVIDSLLTTLSKDNLDMIVILAGYTNEMENMFRSNKGLQSRIPYTFYFEDYSVDELLEIGKMVAKNNRFKFTDSALKALRTFIEKNIKEHSNERGNARFITRLIINKIIPNMSTRIQQLPQEKMNNIRTLTTICKSDIPVYEESSIAPQLKSSFDEGTIDDALNTLNKMVGLEEIKENIQDFVRVARYLHQAGKSYAESFSLRWNFIGNTGTGKSTIAQIMGKLLKAMDFIKNEEITEIKYEEFHNMSEYKMESVFKAAILRSKGGILFIDGDASLFKTNGHKFDGKELLYRISSMMVDIPGNHAIILAENESSKDVIAQNLKSNGLRNFNHTFYFKDYSEEQLLLILKMELEKHKLYLSEKASQTMYQYIKGICSRRELEYANARTMKLIADSITETFYAKPHNNNQIENSDVEAFKWNDLALKKRIGFITFEEPPRNQTD